MATLGQRLRFYWEHLSCRYALEWVSTPRAREQVMALYAEVLGIAPSLPLHSGEGDFQDALLACRDRRDGKLVGVLRGTRCTRVLERPELAPAFTFDLGSLPPSLLADAGYLHQYCILPASRRSAAALALVLGYYRKSLTMGIRLTFMRSEPGIVATYRRLGFRPAGRVRPRPGGGFSLPMVLLNRDIDHLRAVASPYARVWRRVGSLREQGELEWYARCFGPDYDCGLRPARREDLVGAVFAGLGEPSRAALITNATTIAFRRGESVVEAGDELRWTAVVAGGSLAVSLDGRALTRLRAGDLLGRDSGLHAGARGLRITALDDDARILVLSHRAFERVTDLDDRARLWEALARYYSERSDTWLVSMRRGGGGRPVV